MTSAKFPERRVYCPRRVGYEMQERGLLPAFWTPYIKGLVPKFWSKGVEMTEKKAEVVRASEWWR